MEGGFILKKGVMILFSTIILAACGNAAQPQPKHNVNNQPQGVSVKNSHINMNKTYTDEDRSNYLANLAASIPNVDNATAIVIGNVAIVGIDVDDQMDRSEVGTVKYSVAESLKHDPQGAGAIVVADPDITARLGEMRDDLRAGKPVAGILNELSDITSRLIPELPQQSMGENPQQAPEKPKTEMNSENDRMLEKTQQEQSNNHK